MAKLLGFVSLVALFTLATAASPAVAQGPDEPGIAPAAPAPSKVSPPPPPAPPARPAGGQSIVLQTMPRLDELGEGEPRLKSPAAALWLSLGITTGVLAASVAMVVAGAGDDGDRLLGTGMVLGGLGLAFGPSAGHLYAGDTRRGLGMGFVRLAVVGSGVVLELLALGLVGDIGGEPVNGETFCLFAGIGAGVAALALAIWDIAAAPGAARRANERIRRRLAGLTLGPLITPDAGAGKRGHGLALGGRF